jgi:hypothetical protein
MSTKKITLNELRSLVKQIIKEESNNLLKIEELKNNFNKSLKDKKVKIKTIAGVYDFYFSELDFNHLSNLSPYVIFLERKRETYSEDDDLGDMIYLLINEHGQIKKSNIFDPTYEDDGDSGYHIDPKLESIINKKMNPSFKYN